MLQINNLTLIHKKDLTPILLDLSFTLNPGERMAVIGEEGNGKSTLLRVLAGDESALDYIQVSGSFSCRGRIGYLPQELPRQDRALSAYEFFCATPSFFDCSPRELGALAARVRMPADVFYSEQRVCEFSGGERVRLMMLRILIAQPQVLLLDEPSNDIDMETMAWLSSFMIECGLATLFVSHDETLLGDVATSVLLLERLRRRQMPRATVSRMGYAAFVGARQASFARQEQVARKEREEFARKMARFHEIRSQVEHDQNAISRQNPGGGRLLKKKMHAVMSMGRRFEREQEDMTAMPEGEEAIFAKIACEPLPQSKVVLHLALEELAVAGRTLARDIALTVRGREKICITGSNGAGKSTLLHIIRDALGARGDLRTFFMPQDPCDLLAGERTPLEILSRSGDAQERAHNGVMLGSMKFTADEMQHPCAGLSGGQKAKLAFLMMSVSRANVLLLDEPTRNLSPLSGPVLRELLTRYEGCIIAVSHDRMFIREVCTRAYRLDPRGLTEMEI